MRRIRNHLIIVAGTLLAAGAFLVGVGVRGEGIAGVLPSRLGVASTATATPAAAASSPGSAGSAAVPDPVQLARLEREARVAALDAALKKYAAGVPEFSVAVLDRSTGERYAFRGNEKYETASVVKVHVLACLLLQAQDDGRGLTANELSLSKRMIRASDNDATRTLFARVGRVAAVSKCNDRLGLTDTTVSSSSGLTRTTVNDQVTLLEELVDTAGPLDAASRKLAFALMSTVQTDQDWGVSAATAAGEQFTIKNGWLSREPEGGRWIVNSVGRITSDNGVNVSLAVLSHGHTSHAAGIKVVENVAKLTRKHLKY